MTIHEKQGSSARSQDGEEPCGIELHVEETHQLIGETWYDPEIVVTNPGEAPVRIDHIELVTHRSTHKLDQWADERLDRLIPAHAARHLHLGFDLAETPVSEVFKKPAFIRISYTVENIPKSCALEIVGSPI